MAIGKLSDDSQVSEAVEKDDDRSDSHEQVKENANNRLPIDRGWAWVVMLAALLEMFIVIGHLKCFGIVFVQLQDRFGSSSSATSLIFTLQNATYSIGSLLVMTAGRSMSSRVSALIGACLSCIAFFTTAFITDVRVAYASFGILTGVSNALMVPQFATMISTYFVKWIGLANNVSHAGVSIGGLAFAPILTRLFEEFGYTGTFMFMAGFHLNIAIFACLLRPISFYKRTSGQKSEKEQPLLSIETNESTKLHSGSNSSEKQDSVATDFVRHNGSGKHFPRQTSENNAKYKHPVHIQTSEINPKHILRRRYISEGDHQDLRELGSTNNDSKSASSLFNSSMARFASTDVINNSLMDLTLCKADDEPVLTEEKRKFYMTAIRSSIVRLFKRLFDIKLLSKTEFQYFLACNLFLCPGSALATAFLPQLSFEIGIDSHTVAWLVSGMSILELISRLVFGIISDRQWCHRSTIIACSTLVIGIAAQFAHLMASFPAIIVVYAVIAGFLQGVFWALFAVVILDLLTFEEFKGALGFTSLIHGISNSVALLIAGYLRDYTGNYYLTFNFIGILLIIGAVMLFWLPTVQQRSKRRRELKQDNTLEQMK